VTGDLYPFRPRVFADAAIDAESRRIAAELEERARRGPPAHMLSARQHRQRQESGEAFGGPIRSVDAARMRAVESGGRKIPVRVFVPEQVNGLLLAIHGGGFVMGAAQHSDIRNWQIARHCSLVVVTPDYRLAPEAPYPAALDDCEAVALWLLKHGAAEFGKDTLLISGESAGANLAVGTLVRLRDRHGVRLCGASLLFGWYDLALTPSARAWETRELVLSTPFLRAMARDYVEADRLTHPEISPLHADLVGLGSAQFTVGTLDPLLDDTLFLHARWVAAGNPARLHVYPGGVHGFTGLPCAQARAANRVMEEGLLAQLADDVSSWT